MINLLSRKPNRQFLKNPNFWVISIITILIIIIYNAWPWRSWSFNQHLLELFPWLTGLYNITLVEMTYRINGILFLIPIIYATLVFPWPGALAICLISLARVLPLIIDLSPNFYITNIILLMLPFPV